MWNSLNNTIRSVDTLSKFKLELKKIDETENHAVPKQLGIAFQRLSYATILNETKPLQLELIN